MLLSATPVEFTMFSPTEPVAVPVSTVTVQAVPEPVTLLIVAPGEPLRLKLVGLTPVTLRSRVTVQARDVAMEGDAALRLIDSTLTGGNIGAADATDTAPTCVEVKGLLATMVQVPEVLPAGVVTVAVDIPPAMVELLTEQVAGVSDEKITWPPDDAVADIG